ncbi:VanZ family protein [Paraglaciecola hydrolytica]|uniref:VanZ family protein n=1 Tax=Paraglaciecola hydrolytica TaxID=1799789 RepID=UPI001F25C7D2|nr:VanZ family protein [Paraglaciecola hydrolytica]
MFFEFVASFPYGDKVGHAGLFGFLTLVAIIGLRFSRFTLGKLPIYYGGILVSLFVIGEELSQAFIPSRTFDFMDLAADFVGIVVAIGVAHFMRQHLVKNEKICSTK